MKICSYFSKKRKDYGELQENFADFFQKQLDGLIMEKLIRDDCAKSSVPFCEEPGCDLRGMDE